MWHSDQNPDRVRTNQNVQVYLRSTLPFDNTTIWQSGVKLILRFRWERSNIWESNNECQKNGLLTYEIANVQLVLSCLVPNTKPAILRVKSFPIFYSQVYSKLVFSLVSCETVYFIQSEPELTDQVTEAMFVFIPGAVEINRAIHSLLDHCPSPTSCCMVTIYIEGAWTIWVDCVNTADPSTGFVQLSTVFSYWI